MRPALLTHPLNVLQVEQVRPIARTQTVPLPGALSAGIKQVANTTGGGALRYRVGLSDSEHWISALLATQLNELIASKRLSQGSYVRLVDFTIQNLPSQKTKANRCQAQIFWP